MSIDRLLELAPEWLSAIGTVGAVILSLHFARKETRERAAVESLAAKLLARQIQGDVNLSLMKLRRVYNAKDADFERWFRDHAEFRDVCFDIHEHALIRVKQYLPELWKLGVNTGGALADALTVFDVEFRSLVFPKNSETIAQYETRVRDVHARCGVIVHILEGVVPELHRLAGRDEKSG